MAYESFENKKNAKEKVRLGITVTKKVGCANVRNRIKRQTREFFRINKHRLHGVCDINIIAKKEAAVVSSEQLNKSLNEIFARLMRRLQY